MLQYIPDISNLHVDIYILEALRFSGLITSNKEKMSLYRISAHCQQSLFLNWEKNRQEGRRGMESMI